MQLRGLVARVCAVGALPEKAELAPFSGPEADADAEAEAGIVDSETCDMVTPAQKTRLLEVTSFHPIPSLSTRFCVEIPNLARSESCANAKPPIVQVGRLVGSICVGMVRLSYGVSLPDKHHRLFYRIS
jgi:hypothetical protein